MITLLLHFRPHFYHGLLLLLLMMLVLAMACSAPRSSQRRRHHHKAPCRDCPSFSQRAIQQSTVTLMA